MCGIVGIFDLSGPHPMDPDRLLPAMEVMSMRGPDGAGRWSGPGCALGHRRLSILDLAGGAQPWVDPDVSPGALSYNGELYNFSALRNHYALKGYRFKSACDTEVVHAAFETDGLGALDAFNGIFAFAHFDGRDCLTLVRDQLGVKPLYYSIVEQTLYFASTMAALMAFAEIPRKLDPAAAAHYLATVRTNLDSRTLLAGVSMLPPGHYLRVGRGQRCETIRPEAYWRLAVLKPSEKAPLSDAEAIAGCQRRLAESVRLQLQSDVPVGGFLSGGLDSSVLLQLSKEIQGESLGSYGVEFSDAPDSQRESPFMYHVAEALGTRFHCIELEQSIFEPTWTQLIGHHGQPLSTPNEVAIYHMSRALRRDYTVALGGEGADEIFGGYLLPYASAWDYARTEEKTYSSVLRQRIKVFYGASKFPHMADHHLALNVWMKPGQVSALLGQPIDGAWEAVANFYREQLDRSEGASPLDRYLHLHLRVNLEGLLLRLDANTMAASVEGRVPFTDRGLVEWANTLSDQQRLRREDRTGVVPWRDHVAADWIQRGWVKGKWVLREAARDRLPAAIVSRPKQSFPVPFEEILARQSSAQKEWSDHFLAKQRLLDPLAVNQFWAETGMPGAFFRRWPLLNLLRWADHWKVNPA